MSAPGDAETDRLVLGKGGTRGEIARDLGVADPAAAELRALRGDLAIMTSRLQGILDAGWEHPATDEMLRDAEQARRAAAGLEDAATALRDRVIQRAVEQRFPYRRISEQTGLSSARVGQIAPVYGGSPAARGRRP